MVFTCQPIMLRWPHNCYYLYCLVLIEISQYVRHRTKHRSADGSCPLGLQTNLNKMTATWITREVNYRQGLKLDLEKAEEPEIKLPISTGSSKNQESYRKISTFALLAMSKPLCASQLTENMLRDGNSRPPDLSPEKSVCRSRSNS